MIKKKIIRRQEEIEHKDRWNRSCTKKGDKKDRRKRGKKGREAEEYKERIQKYGSI